VHNTHQYLVFVSSDPHDPFNIPKRLPGFRLRSISGILNPLPSLRAGK
jgi:hypothetical protein